MNDPFLDTLEKICLGWIVIMLSLSLGYAARCVVGDSLHHCLVKIALIVLSTVCGVAGLAALLFVAWCLGTVASAAVLQKPPPPSPPQNDEKQ